MTSLAAWHPAIEAWFRRRFPEGPTPPQTQAWPSIAAGRHTLLAAPTGSGKTLAALLVAIDRLYQQHCPLPASRLAGPAAEQPANPPDHPAEQPANPPDHPAEQVQVVYISPLKALATDISENLERPLAEIAECARELNLEPPPLSVFVRSGDTPQAERLAMLRRPPSFVITTPESFYLLLTAAKSREMLHTTQLVIVDEIHATARDKRGSHLALSLERLDHICHRPPQRVGLSATQRPLDKIAGLLVGSQRSCEIIDTGHLRQLDLAVHLPDTELEAVPSHEQTQEVLSHIAGQVAQHRTTLVFVNTRRLAERIAHQLSEMLGDDQVAAHHGSLSKERRWLVENRLRAGNLKVLVATASLELGIDIGPVELVCQLGSPRSIAVFLQRVGRSNHSRHGTPKGRLYPLTRDELVECAALLRAVSQQRLDAVEPPVAPRDILVQQVIAECAAETWRAGELFQLVRQAAPYHDLRPEEFEAALELATQGVVCGHGAKGAYLRWNKLAGGQTGEPTGSEAELNGEPASHCETQLADEPMPSHQTNLPGELSARRGARLAALTSGGAIPDVADYRVVLDPDDTFIGTVHEDWAVESMAGDVFLLGTHAWRIRRVEPGVVRVIDAEGSPPTLPFWLGEAPGRTAELSHEVGQLLELVEQHLAAVPDPATPDPAAPGAPTSNPAATRQLLTALQEQCLLSSDAAEFLLSYLTTSRALLQTLPSHKRLVVERFFDETGGMQLVVHSPYGSRVNRGLGLALRKRFCRSFDFELQAAANDNAVVLSLGPQHSFPLAEIASYVTSNSVRGVLEQAVLPTPIFTARWRWNLNRALTVLRFKQGRRNPPQIQRMEADDVMAAVFPSLAACQDNTPGPDIDIPDHLLVNQTIDDALSEALDLSRLTELLRDLEANRVEMCFVDTPEPSPLAHEILNGKPFTYLDDAPLEERRTQAVVMRRGLDPSQIASLDSQAIEQVKAEVQPNPRDADELHDVLAWHVALAARAEWHEWFEQLVSQGRAGSLRVASEADAELWYPVELAGEVAALWPDAMAHQTTTTKHFASDPMAHSTANPTPDPAEAAVRLIRGHLDSGGPMTLAELTQASWLAAGQVKSALAELERQGYVLQGSWDAAANRSASNSATQWCSRRLLQRCYHYSKKHRRGKVELATAQDFMRFLLRWQHVAPDCQVRGATGLSQIIAQLQGWEMPAAVWESEALSRRVKHYDPSMLDELCLSGEVAWGRLSLSSRAEAQDPANSVVGPSKTTPITLALRGDLDWLLATSRGSRVPWLPTAGVTAEIIEILQTRGARFLAELLSDTNRLPEDLENGLRDGIARGWLTSDSFSSLRLLLGKRQSKNSYARSNYARTRSSRSRAARLTRASGRPWSASQPLGSAALQPWGAQGRWVLLCQPQPDNDELANQPVSQPAANHHSTDEPAIPNDELAEIFAEQLLRRWGVVFYDLFALENCALPWREVQWAMRRLEARGVILGGRFVSGFTGEQFALPAAADELRWVAKQPRTQQTVTISATDPLNLTGVLTGTPRVPALHTRQVSYLDGQAVTGNDPGDAYGHKPPPNSSPATARNHKPQPTNNNPPAANPRQLTAI